ncbi:DUF1707 SHOCT-like domain-containing protein [Actinomadura flavalba]|uniref:DUF1707 SHOCT-like domain-containing protein n=1 Tax=Actinomadura flavalba TaxID=1120938 RepID=UPI001F0B05ED|nr:DUF1707 domain-containing protein [Actinomadura flavalba]
MNQPTPQQEPRPSAPHLDESSVRVSDAEREAVVERLRVASVEGRLTFEELSERTDAAYAARTRAELDRVTQDLPAMGAPSAGPAPSQSAQRFTAILGDCRERVSGRVDRKLEALSVLGDVVLDLRGAQVPGCEVAITATAVLGDVKIIVPDGVRVEMTGYAVLGDRRVKVRQPDHDGPAPVVRIRAQAVLGDIKILDDEHHGSRRKSAHTWWDRHEDRD